MYIFRGIKLRRAELNIIYTPVQRVQKGQATILKERLRRSNTDIDTVSSLNRRKTVFPMLHFLSGLSFMPGAVKIIK